MVGVNVLALVEHEVVVERVGRVGHHLEGLHRAHGRDHRVGRRHGRNDAFHDALQDRKRGDNFKEAE